MLLLFVKDSGFPVDLENCITLDEVGCEDDGGQTGNCDGPSGPSGPEVLCVAGGAGRGGDVFEVSLQTSHLVGLVFVSEPAVNTQTGFVVAVLRTQQGCLLQRDAAGLHRRGLRPSDETLWGGGPVPPGPGPAAG